MDGLATRSRTEQACSFRVLSSSPWHLLSQLLPRRTRLPVRWQYLISATANPAEIVPFVKMILRSVNATSAYYVRTHGTFIQMRERTHNLVDPERPIASLRGNLVRYFENFLVYMHDLTSESGENTCLSRDCQVELCIPPGRICPPREFM